MQTEQFVVVTEPKFIESICDTRNIYSLVYYFFTDSIKEINPVSLIKGKKVEIKDIESKEIIIDGRIAKYNKVTYASSD